jgi:hypothetical protein
MSPINIVVTGLIGSIPLPGLTYHYLRYFLGLARLGHRVHYLEDTGSWNYAPATDTMTPDAEESVRYLAAVMEQCGLGDAWTFVNHDGEVFGTGEETLRKVLSEADLFINVTGANLMRDHYLEVPVRVYLDTDPGFIQMRTQSGSEKDLGHLNLHNRFASFGANICKSNCGIPALGLDWFPTAQPIVPELWPLDTLATTDSFVTIMKWKCYDPVEFEGKSYGLKDKELQQYLELPSRVQASFKLAVLGEGPKDLFEQAGWEWSDASPLNLSTDAYQDFFRQARGEWSVAKGAYVGTRSGWFSDRSASLMMMGRPVVVQSTGFEDWLPTGEGVLSFDSLESAADAVAKVQDDYERHAQRARELAEAHFGHDVVLPALIDWAMQSENQTAVAPACSS